MKKTLIIAEKPSVAGNIAEALNIKSRKNGYYEGNGYYVTWAFGHLLELFDVKDYKAELAKWEMENFPFIPSEFKYKVKESSKLQFHLIEKLSKLVNSLVLATDFDREGQVIGDLIIGHINTKKPVYRLLLNEWTPDSVIQGLKKMKLNAELKPLQDAGIGRQWADWVIGINLTSVATLKYQKGRGKVLNVGRVLFPTLKIIYDRDKAIENFVPEKYFKLAATFQTNEGQEYEGTYVENDEEKFRDPGKLESLHQKIKEQSASILDKKVEEKKEYPPSLFNLSNLQGHVTSKFQGWTSDKVLKIAQSLYEKKFVTYPRTESKVLEESLVDRAAKVLEKLKSGLPYENEVVFKKTKRVFDNSKVDSHSAIIPTYLIPTSLTPDEEVVYTSIKNRFIMQFMPVAEYEETRIQTKVNPSEVPGVFISKGKVQKVEGWKKVEKVDSKDTILPLVNIGESVMVTSVDLTDHITNPPKSHTEKTLLRIMETCGKGQEEDKETDEMMVSILNGYSVGTAATRAETIKKLKDVGYIKMKKKSLVCTQLGRKLVETFPVKELFDLEFTGRLEKALSDIEKKKFTKDSFLKVIFNFTIKAVEKIKADQDIVISDVEKEQKKYEVLGNCPLCASGIIEGQKGYGCSNWKGGCKFVIWKNDKYLASMKKKPTKSMIKSLLKDGTVLVKGLTSQKGNKFDAILRYEKNNDNEYFSWKMEFQKK